MPRHPMMGSNAGVMTDGRHVALDVGLHLARVDAQLLDELQVEASAARAALPNSWRIRLS